MFKESVSGSIWLSETGLDGDETTNQNIASRKDRALLAYPLQHYDYWNKELDMETNPGDMGENLVIVNEDEYSVFIGDIFQIGDAIIQVSEPRLPSWKVARRFRIMELAQMMQTSGRTGWYFRVIKEGLIEEGDEMLLMERLNPEWAIAACNEVMHLDSNLRLINELALVKGLSENWKRILHSRLSGRSVAIDERIYGPNKAT